MHGLPAPERYQQQSSHDRKVLQEVDRLHSLLCIREGLKVMEDDRDRDQVEHPYPGTRARFESEQSRQSSADFKSSLSAYETKYRWCPRNTIK